MAAVQTTEAQKCDNEYAICQTADWQTKRRKRLSLIEIVLHASPFPPNCVGWKAPAQTDGGEDWIPATGDRGGEQEHYCIAAVGQKNLKSPCFNFI